MKKIIYSLSLLVTALIIAGLGSCRTNQAADDNSRIVDIHNSRISLDWNGGYSGIIPSADGPGISVLIVLNSDDTFELSYSYLKQPEDQYTSKGSFKWNDAGNIITLEVEDWPPYYLVGENKLIQLDMEGKVITGNLAENYVLKKSLD
jgi:uncharacterized lipoprotein NlpE involved in copper resistance